MKKSILYVLVAVLFSCLLLFTLLIFLLPRIDNCQNEALGNRVVLRIDSFERKHHHLPASLSEIGFDEGEDFPIYYSIRDTSSYVISFATGFGESRAFYSETGKWED